MNRFMGEGDLVHFGCDSWEIVETSIVWRGRFIMLLLRTKINNGWVDIDIMDMPGQDKLGLHKDSTIKFQ